MGSKDPFAHRKYHGLYFVLGFIIAVVLVLALGGCQQGTTDKGKDCIGFAGMSVTEIEACEPPEPPVMCCQALTPPCAACDAGLPEDEWLEITCGENAVGAEYAYWDTETNKPVWLCQSEIIN